MNKKLRLIICFALVLGLSGFCLVGCEDQSEGIPTGTSWLGISDLMAEGWAAYADNDFELAYDKFLEANQRNAFYLPAYNGLGWSAVRLTDFSDAGIQFSFITTLADPESQVDLLADAYAGLCLSATIERSVLEISGEGTQVALNVLAEESILMAQMVFDLQGETYDPADHDPGFGSTNLHLLNAQNYFYLQDFGNSENQLGTVDPDFIAGLLDSLGAEAVEDTLLLSAVISEADTSWFLYPTYPAIHNVTAYILPDPAWQVEYGIVLGENNLQVIPSPETELYEGAQFVVSYVYIVDLAQYLYELIEHIQGLIEI